MGDVTIKVGGSDDVGMDANGMTRADRIRLAIERHKNNPEKVAQLTAWLKSVEKK